MSSFKYLLFSSDRMQFDTTVGRNFVRVYVENVVIICHGLPYEPASVIAKGYDKLATMLSRSGLNSVIFDFSGTGLSKGSFRLSHWVEDLLRIVENFESVHLLAFSLGGVPAVYCAQHENVRTLTLVAVPAGMNMVREDLLIQAHANAKLRGSLRGIGDLNSFLESFRRDMEEYEPRRWMEFVRKPVLIVHGTRDDIIPFESGKILYELAKEPKYFLRVVGGHHRLRDYPQVMRRVIDWIAMHYSEGSFEGKMVDMEV